MKRTKLIYGIGVNDADYSVRNSKCSVDSNGKRHFKIIWLCPFYHKWKSMITRCYSNKYQSKNPTYVGCTVCNEWLYFSKFKAWMETQDWEGKQLDKDFLIPGNTVYSPETCLFIPQRLNVFFSKGKVDNLISKGITFSEKVGKYRARCSNGEGKMLCFGYFSELEDAKEAWKEAKLAVLLKILDEDAVEDRVKQAAINKFNTETIKD